jgi:hypothetical protein
MGASAPIFYVYFCCLIVPTVVVNVTPPGVRQQMKNWEQLIQEFCDTIGFQTSIKEIQETVVEWRAADVTKVLQAGDNDVCILFQRGGAWQLAPDDWTLARAKEASKKLDEYLSLKTGEPSYVYCCNVRKAYGRRQGMEYDCRTYWGQPDRNMVGGGGKNKMKVAA